MEDKVYSITLSDGTVIKNLKLNGNNFISVNQLDPEIFEDNCSPVIINDGEKVETHEHMEFIQTIPLSGENEFWFVLKDMSEEELATIKIQSQIEYIAMMTGVEL